MEIIRKLRVISTGHILTLWDTNRRYDNSKFSHNLLGYKFEDKSGNVLFEGEDYGCPVFQCVDSDRSVISLMNFLTLKPGDTDSEYFDSYTEEQLDWANSSECENLSCDLCIIESDSEYEGSGISDIFEDLGC